MTKNQRLAALEGGNSTLHLHLPQDHQDHAAELARLNRLGGKIGVIHYPGFNDEAVAAFRAA